MSWMTAEEVADRYRISVKGLLKQRSENRMPGSLGRRVGKRVLWASEDLNSYDNPEAHDHELGTLDALVLEMRGVNKRLRHSHQPVSAPGRPDRHLRGGILSEGITFDEAGTITVEFDDRKWIISRVKLRHLRHFRRALQQIRDDTKAQLAELAAAAEKATTKTAQAKATAELAEFSESPFYESVIPWMREVFVQLSDPLPEDENEWPAWLAADGTLPPQMIGHWQTHPKAFGENPS